MIKGSLWWRTLLSRVGLRTRQVAGVLLLMLCVAAPLLIIYNIGFPITPDVRHSLSIAYRSILSGQWVLITALMLLSGVEMSRQKGSTIPRIVGFFAFTIIVFANISLQYRWIATGGLISAITADWVIMLTLLSVSLTELSRSLTAMLRHKTNPAMILAGSFLFIILVGSLLLMLPNSTKGAIHYIDSLFLSTSAVCVTGLTPIDISEVLTRTGTVILLILIQIGGLGMMTITSFFGLFFAGGRSFAGQMVVGDLLSTDKMSSLLRTLAHIMIVTFAIEAVGAIFLYGSAVDSGHFTHSEALFFAIFHSISAFCNAGFSTLSDGLANPVIAHLNTMRWVIGFLIIFGGIGFPIFANFLHFLAHKIQNTFRRLYGIRPSVMPHLWRLNTYIVVLMTLILVVGGWVAFLALEWNASLAGMDIWQKMSQGFLMAVTPRTAGFNGVAMNAMLPASILLTTLLMWVGGAPQSTAGGIKVTTAYVALRNILSSTVSRSDLDVHGRRIPPGSVKRSFAVIALSLLTISTGVFIMSVAEPQIAVGDLVFEAVSAISTVGLSVGVTAEVGNLSKYILIVLMFVGRVGLISIVVIFFKQSSLKPKPYSYPQEDILIT